LKLYSATIWKRTSTFKLIGPSKVTALIFSKEPFVLDCGSAHAQDLPLLGTRRRVFSLCRESS
jgi:hypothetical protein